MQQSTMKWLILGLSFVGIADAAYLAESALTDTPLVCGIDGLSGCNLVAQSVYSHLFGIPLGVYGVFFYCTVFIVAGLALYLPRIIFVRGLFALGVLGLVSSVIFVCIQFFLIKALCIYCLGSAVISIFLFFISFSLWKRGGRAAPPPLPAPMLS
jgi:uncharacterized membrane protein